MAEASHPPRRRELLLRSSCERPFVRFFNRRIVCDIADPAPVGVIYEQVVVLPRTGAERYFGPVSRYRGSPTVAVLGRGKLEESAFSINHHDVAMDETISLLAYCHKSYSSMKLCWKRFRGLVDA